MVIRIKRAYYYFYYRIYKTFSKDDHPLLSVGFRADIMVMMVKTWLLGSIFIYLHIVLGKEGTSIFTGAKAIIALAFVIGSTIYFFTSGKWKLYFEEFEKLPKRKNIIGGIIVWGIVILSFINLLIAMKLAE